MVQEIEHIETELHGHLLANWEVLAEAGVGGPERGIAEIVARLRAEGPSCGLSEDGGLEPDETRGGEVAGGDGAVAGLGPELTAAAGADTGNVLTGAHRKRRARLVLENARDFPAAD